MYLPNELIEILKNIGYGDSNNIGEFWFSNREEIAKEVNKKYPGTLMQKFDNQIRWKTDIGIECQKQVRKYIEKHMQEYSDKLNQAFKDKKYFNPQDVFILDFSSFSFSYKGNTYNLNDFQELYNNAKIYPAANLMGIDLHDIKINHCTLRDVSLADANLIDAQIGSVTFSGSSLRGAILTNSRMGQIRFINGGGMGGSDVKGALLNAVCFDNESVPGNLDYSFVSYFYLIKCLFFSIYKNGIFNENIMKPHKHTIFLFNDTKELTSQYNFPFKNYVEWYQYIFTQLQNYKDLRFPKKILFTCSLLFTKAWTSYTALAVFAFLINCLFALIYFINSSSLKDFDGSFLTAFYYSVVTFTTLGYGEIIPITDFAKVIVILEVLFGYVTLGSFIFLIGHRVNNRF